MVRKIFTICFGDLLASKKARMALLGFLGGLLAKLGYELSAAELLTLQSPILAYMGAQGMADMGKGAAQIVDSELVDK